jgi:hypothetical protein
LLTTAALAWLVARKLQRRARNVSIASEAMPADA